jgi:hypothetical protein
MGRKRDIRPGLFLPLAAAPRRRGDHCSSVLWTNVRSPDLSLRIDEDQWQDAVSILTVFMKILDCGLLRSHCVDGRLGASD